MRKYYLDNVRWLTVVVVLLYHVIYMYNAEDILGGLGRITTLSVQPYDIFAYLVYPWIMPVLFIVAGISSRLSLEKYGVKQFVKSRTRKLLVPSTLGLFVFYFIQGYVSMHLSEGGAELAAMGVPKIIIYFIMVLSGSGVLWFVHLLWLYSMILLLFRVIEKGKLLKAGAKTPMWLIILFILPVWLFAQILNTPIISVYRIGFYFLFFMLGYYVFSNDEIMEKLKKFAIPFAITGAVFCIIFAIYYFVVKGGANYADKPVNRLFLYSACSYFGSLGLLAVAAKYWDKQNKFTKWMSAHSFGLYVFHYLGISSVALFVAKPGLVPPAVSYLLSLIAGFAFGYILYEIISRIPIYRWFVLGIKKEKKNV